ncbi:hypothetical protein GQ55_8G167300 [Panicum hallii var. hallii]|uniref:Uncharacterized protein n=1 Tax=Panicum hallii var. hallii TaxID=1504633 RepID=A0A2T7CNG9_9POAL|nr:hypothetical protein GQ55_8G167300 [Panicum hallii var. hallii]
MARLLAADPNPCPPLPLPLHHRRVRLPPRPHHQGRCHRDRLHRGGRRSPRVPRRLPVSRGGGDPFIRCLEEAIHGAMVRHTTPDWFPFVLILRRLNSQELWEKKHTSCHRSSASPLCSYVNSAALQN